MEQRRDEEPRVWFRSDRVFRVDEEWFIHTREGIAVGPYSDRFAADVDAEVLRSLLREAPAAEAEDVIRGFISSGAGNLRSVKELAPGFDADQVTSLLEEDDFDFDSIRQLS
jgi:hypothetical protein